MRRQRCGVYVHRSERSGWGWGRTDARRVIRAAVPVRKRRGCREAVERCRFASAGSSGGQCARQLVVRRPAEAIYVVRTASFPAHPSLRPHSHPCAALHSPPLRACRPCTGSVFPVGSLARSEQTATALPSASAYMLAPTPAASGLACLGAREECACHWLSSACLFCAVHACRLPLVLRPVPRPGCWRCRRVGGGLAPSECSLVAPLAVVGSWRVATDRQSARPGRRVSARALRPSSSSPARSQ